MLYIFGLWLYKWPQGHSANGLSRCGQIILFPRAHGYQSISHELNSKIEILWVSVMKGSDLNKGTNNTDKHPFASLMWKYQDEQREHLTPKPCSCPFPCFFAKKSSLAQTILSHAGCHQPIWFVSYHDLQLCVQDRTNQTNFSVGFDSSASSCDWAV